MALAHLTPMEAQDVGCDVCIPVGPVLTLCSIFFGLLKAVVSGENVAMNFFQYEVHERAR